MWGTLLYDADKAVGMRHFLITDIEGVAGIDAFERTRTDDETQKAPAMDQLAREVNACIEGIRAADSDATIDVWDGHGSGGLRENEVDGATYLCEGQPYYDLSGFDSLLFVGQHAMAGTAFAPLRHTYSSTNVDYYKLNGTFIGEFGCRALVAGMQDVPTIFLAGDDKACHEAEIFVPEIETVATKFGKGEQAAKHKDRDAVLEEIRAGATRAVERLTTIPPLTDFEPPYELVMRFYNPVADDQTEPDNVELIDEHAIRMHGESIQDFQGTL